MNTLFRIRFECLLQCVVNFSPQQMVLNINRFANIIVNIYDIKIHI